MESMFKLWYYNILWVMRLLKISAKQTDCIVLTCKETETLKFVSAS